MCRIIEKWRNKQKLLTKVSVTAFWPLATFTQDPLVITAQPSPGFRRRNFHTFLHFIVFTTTLHKLSTLASLLRSNGPFCCLPAHSEIVFPPFLSIFVCFDLIVLTRQIVTYAESSLFVQFSSDIHRTNPRTRRGVKNINNCL